MSSKYIELDPVSEYLQGWIDHLHKTKSVFRIGIVWAIKNFIEKLPVMEFDEDEYKRLKEKQIPKKPIVKIEPLMSDFPDKLKVSVYYCPVCNEYISMHHFEGTYEHCPKCGQAIDWLESEES